MDKECKFNMFFCACHDIEHQFALSFWGDEEFPMLTMEINLVDYSRIWKRAWYALRYIFGYKCRYGAFDEVLINKKTAIKMRDYLNEIIPKLSNTDEWGNS